jgi:metal-responsive CopG/Arc/MetJ family transcriptional regulator
LDDEISEEQKKRNELIKEHIIKRLRRRTWLHEGKKKHYRHPNECYNKIYVRITGNQWPIFLHYQPLKYL